MPRTRFTRALVALVLASDLLAPPALALPSDGSTLAADRGRAPGDVPGSAGVEPDLFHGTATWSLALELPPGAGGLGPALALRYSSAGSADSWVGVGWSLGLSSVRRSVRHGSPGYDDARDVFELDGEELVRDPQIPGRWRTRRERFLRVEQESDGSFTVRRPDGTWLRLGTRADAIVTNAEGRPFEWMQTELHDASGNVVAAWYDRRDPGIAHLAELRWTLRRDASGGLRSLDDDPTRDRVVRFGLEPRPDRTVSHLAGLPRVIAHRLARIDVEAQGALLRRWTLGYVQSAESGRSLLASISHWGVDADAPLPTPPRVTQFSYATMPGGSGPRFVHDASWSSAWPSGLAFVRDDLTDGALRIADVDGDGLPDLVKALGLNPGDGGDVVSSSDSGVYRGTGTGFEPTPSVAWPLPVFTGATGNRIPLSFTYQFPSGLVWGNGTWLTDVTGDGRADVIGAIGFVPGSYPGFVGPLAQSFQSEWCEATRAGFRCRAPAGSLADGFSFTGKQGATFDFSSFGYRFMFLGGNAQLADVDGDGLPDLVARGRDRLVDLGGECLHETLTSSVAYNRGGLVFEHEPPVSGNVATPSCPQVTLNVSPRHQPCSPADASCTARLAFNETQLYGDAFGSALWLFAGHQEHGRLEVDVNGDGLADSLGATRDRGSFTPWTALGDGRGGAVDAPGLALPVPLQEIVDAGVLDPFSAGRSIDLGVRLADLNGDGRLDVVRAREGDPAGPAIWWNRGDPLGPGGVFVASSDPADALPDGLAFSDAAGRDLGVRIVDVDGDGLADLVRARGGQVDVWRNRREAPDRLREVVLPTGGATRLSYAPSTAFRERTMSELPRDRTRPVLVGLDTDDARGNVGHVSIHYAQGHFDPQRRESLGFGHVTVVDPLGQLSITQFHQDEARLGLVKWAGRMASNGPVLASEELEYSSDEDGVAPFVALPIARTRREWDGLSTARSSRVEMQWDGGGPITLGRLTATIELGEVDDAGHDLDPSDTRTIEHVHTTPGEAPFIADRVAIERVWQGRPGSGSVLRERRLFYDGDVTGGAAPSRGLLTRRVDVLGLPGEADPTTTFAHDVYGNLIRVTGPRTNAGQATGSTSFELDPWFHTFRIASVDALGHRIEIGLDADPLCRIAAPRGLGLPQQEGGPNEIAAGTRRRRCFDAFGRLVTDIAPAGRAITTWSYRDVPGDAWVRRWERATESTLLRSETRRLDGLGREYELSRQGPGRRTILSERVYDAAGHVVLESAPHYWDEPAQYTRTSRDALGRVVETELPGTGRIWRLSYAHGTVTRSGPSGEVERRHHDAHGRLRAVDLVDGGSTRTTTYDWTPLDALAGITSPTGHRTSIAYDALGRRRQLVDPDVGVESFVLDAEGLVLERRSATGTITFSHDALGRVLTRRVNGAIDASWAWDSAPGGLGRLAARSNGLTTERIDAYDDEGRVLAESHVRGGRTLSFATTFDPLGQPTSRRYPDGRTIYWSHDDVGYLDEISSDDGVVASGITWSASGELVGWQAPNGARWTASHDVASGRLDEIAVHDASGAAQARLAWRFDASDRVAGIDDRLQPGASRAFQYDGLGRLTRADGPFDVAGGTRALHYAYDAEGNLVCKDARDLAGCTGGSVLAIASGHAHRLASVDGRVAQHDARGRLQQLGDRFYQHDALDRLQAISVGTDPRLVLLHDVDGRVARSIDLAHGTPRIEDRIADDFDWDVTRGLARIHVGLGGSTIASIVAPFSGTGAATVAPAAPLPAAAPLAVALALALGCALALAVGLRRRPGLVRADLQSAIAAGLVVALLSATAHAALAGPDGDLDANGRFDVADVLRALQIARAQRVAAASELVHGDVAPLGTGSSPPAIDVADVSLLLRGLRGDDVDGDGLDADTERGLGTSAFRADSDADGLSDAAEQSALTDPLDRDTDGDGLLDGADAEPRRGLVLRMPDALGSPLLVLRADGGIVERPVFLPFGQRADGAAGVPMHGFAGHRGARELGLHLAGTRWYDETLGRFLQPDSLVPDPADPRSHDRFAYAENDPLRLVDPSGNTPFLASVLGVVAGGFAAASGTRGGMAFLGATLGFALGRTHVGLSLRSDGSLLADLGLLRGIPILGQTRQAASPQGVATRLRALSVQQLRPGDVLLTRDGGSAQALAWIPGSNGYGHAAYVLSVEGERVDVASSDNRGRYSYDNRETVVGGRHWDVFRTGETLDGSAARRTARAGIDERSFTEGLRDYFRPDGRNLCSSWVAEVYRQAGGAQLGTDRLVTPGEIADRIGPPIGSVYIPLLPKRSDEEN